MLGQLCAVARRVVLLMILHFMGMMCRIGGSHFDGAAMETIRIIKSRNSTRLNDQADTQAGQPREHLPSGLTGLLPGSAAVHLELILSQLVPISDLSTNYAVKTAESVKFTPANSCLARNREKPRCCQRDKIYSRKILRSPEPCWI